MKQYKMLAAFLVCNMSLLQAQTTSIDSIKTHQLKEVVVTAQFAPTTEKNAVYKVKVISQKTIDAKAANNLTELLQQELNVDLSANSAFGTSLELHGVSKENIKILVDGVPLIGRVNGTLNLNQINLDNVARIEVIEGAVSVFYGTDASGGTINIITKNKIENDFAANLKLFYESIAARSVSGSVAANFGKNLVRFETGKYSFNGLNTNDDFKRTLNWASRNNYYGNAKYVREIGNFKVNLSTNMSEELLNTLGEVKASTHKAKDIDYVTRRWDNTLNVNGTIGTANFIDATFSYLNYNRFDNLYRYDETTNTTTLLEGDVDGNEFTTYFAKAQYGKNNTLSKFNYVVGVEYQSDKGVGDRILNTEQTVENTSIFGSVNYKLFDKLVIQPGARYTNNSTFGGLISPALNLKLKINNSNTVRMSYANGFRAPSIKQLYLDWHPTFGPFTYNITGNEDLEVEASNNFNLQYTYVKHFANWGCITVDPSVYYNETKNLIGLSNMVAFSRHYINLNKTKTLSTNLNIKYVPNANLTFNIGIAYLGRYFEYTDKFDSDGFMFTPSVNAGLSYVYQPFGLTLNSFYKFTGEKDGHYIKKVSGTPTLFENTRDSFSNLDISLSKSLLNKKMTISIGAKNILDVTDVETFNQIGVAHNRDMQLWGASYFIQTKFNF